MIFKGSPSKLSSQTLKITIKNNILQATSKICVTELIKDVRLEYIALITLPLRFIDAIYDREMMLLRGETLQPW